MQLHQDFLPRSEKMTIIPMIRRNYLCFNSCDMYLTMIMMIFDLDVKVDMKKMKMKILINLVFKNHISRICQ